MKSKKSTYDKLFIYIVFIILSINLLLGVIIVTVSSAVYKSSKLNELQSIGDLFIGCMQDNYSVTKDTRSDVTKSMHKKFSSKYHLMIYIYDENGNCVLSDADYNPDPKKVVKNSSKISVAEIDSLSNKDYLDVSSSSISANEPYMIYGTC